ncbi:MAG: hypothetical protein AAFZ65_12165, partial [Planctomycetota bacterium]
MGPAEPPDRPPRRELAAVSLLALLLGLVWTVAVPPFMGPDEPWHLERAELAARGHRATRGDAAATLLPQLPPSAAQLAARYPRLEPAMVGAGQEALLEALVETDWFARVDWAADPGRARSFDVIHPSISAGHHPSGYYQLLGLWLRCCPLEAPAARLRFARLLSVAAYASLGLASLTAGWALGGERTGRLAAAATLLAPPSTRLASTVSNDAGAALLASVALLAWLAFERRPQLRWAGLSIGAVAAAPWVKPTALSTAVLLPAFAWRSRGPRPSPRRVALGVGACLVAVVGGWFALRHSPILPAGFAPLVERV